jgi:hypothetical protein
MSPQTIRPGDRVRDRDDPDPNDAIVVNRPPQTASEWEIEARDCTLADDNPDYPEQAAVIVVCFVDDLVEYGPLFDPTDQTERSLATLNEVGVHFYTFPAPRLDVIESPATGLPGTEPTRVSRPQHQPRTTQPLRQHTRLSSQRPGTTVRQRPIPRPHSSTSTPRSKPTG